MNSIAQLVSSALGVRVTDVQSMSGGDINQAFALTLADGRTVFAKTNARAPQSMFPAEARGLAWLGEPGALRVPRVLACSAETADSPAAEGRSVEARSTEGRLTAGPTFLVLEHITPGRKGRGFDETLGRGLAALHRAGAPGFGLDHDNFIGSLPQANARLPDWPTFFRTRRLEPQLARATNSGLSSRAMREGFARLFDRLPALVGPPEPPSRLHGDLWGGNLLVDETGAPCLINPAVYGGHREMDLAMMRLFGGFGPRVFAAYDEAHPLAPGHEDRIALYQLYPLLVHVNLFGGGYVAQVEDALAAVV